jgi:hypothetical protein
VLVTGCLASTVVRGSGRIATEQRTLPEFERLDVCSIGEVHVCQGEVQAVEIATDDNLLPLVETEVDDNRLRISVDDAAKDVTSLEVWITMR